MIEQYLRPAIAVLFQVKHPSVSVKVAPDPLPSSGVAVARVVGGKTVYAPGSITTIGVVTLPVELIVAVNFAGVPVPPFTVNVRVVLLV